MNLRLNIQDLIRTDKIGFLSARNTTKALMPFWIGALITTLVSVAYAKIFLASETLAVSWSHAHAEWAFVVMPVGILVSAFITRKFSPEAAGSGIPQIIAAAEIAKEDSIFLRRLLGLKTLLVKIVSSAICIASGGMIGREGPTLQIASGIFYKIHKLWPAKFGVPNLQSMILAGGAAGLAAAFNTPLGGIVFAVEELSKVHISKIRTEVFHSVIFAGLLTKAVMGDYLYIGKISVDAGSFGEIWRISIFALAVGAIAAAMGSGMLKVMAFVRARSKATAYLNALLCGLIVATLFYFIGESNIGSGREVIQRLLENPNDHATILMSLGRIFGSFFTYVSGVAGGVFAPALATGAALGSWIGQYFPMIDTRILVLSGMVAFLTGLTRTPFTSFILVFEMTDSHAAIVTLMAASICAYGSSKFISHESFYEASCRGILERFAAHEARTA